MTRRARAAADEAVERRLREFWRRGKLVRNDAHPHPYRSLIPEEHRSVRRWYLLDTDRDPARPWTHKTNLPVFSLALVRGRVEQRRWLLFAHAPLKSQPGVRITIPGYGPVQVDVLREGVFYLIQEAGRSVSRIRTGLN